MALMGEFVVTQPSSFKEAVQQPVWVDAMVEEHDSIVCSSVWDVVPRPEDKSDVSSSWLYKVNQAVDGSVEKHKARFVACGFSQVKRIMLLQYISTEEQDVDILTKALSKCKFEFHRDRIKVADNPFLVQMEC